ncbi:unnamed protein product [Sphagnum troendelagicum]|uniref:RING-type E3 ubiquitin transferase n=1 Tax=Sphagnum troendelagicum TaxID=128251 RepID=A0ABP0U6U0_9BRYO
MEGLKATVKKKSSWSLPFIKPSRKEVGGVGGLLSNVLPPGEFVCRISQSLMAEPVLVASGYSFERQCIQRWFQLGFRHCFESGVVLENTSLTPNLQLQTAIVAWCDKHKVARPQPPSPDLTWQLVEFSLSRAAPASAVAALVREDSDPARPGFSGDRTPDLFDDKSDVFSGRNGDIEAAEEEEYETASAPSWTTRDLDTPVWKRRGLQGSSSLSSSSSGESSREFNNKSSEFSRSSRTDQSSLQSSSYNNHPNSGEWPAASLLQQSSFVSSLSSHGISEAEEYGATEGDVEEMLLYKLHHRHAIEQEEGASEIRRLARNTDPSVDYRETLCTPDVLKALLSLLQSRYPGVQTNAVAAILNLSLADDNRIRVVRAGAIPPLIHVLKSGTDAAQEYATGAFRSLALSEENKMVIGVLGAIPPLIHVLRVGSSGAQRDAAKALYQLSFYQTNCGKMIKAGAVGILLQILQEKTSDLVALATQLLSNLAVTQEGRSLICEGNGIAVLISLIAYKSSPDPLDQDSGDGSSSGGVDDWATVQAHAAAALVQLSNHNLRFRAQALQAGALEPLTMLAEQGTQRARDKATLLLNILCTERKLTVEGNTALYAPALYGH